MVVYKTKNLYILLAFLLIALISLIAVSIYFCFIKFQTKHKHLLPFYGARNKEIDIKNLKIHYNLENKEFKEIDIKNCSYYYFDNIIKMKDGSKPLQIKFGKYITMGLD